MKHLPGIFIVIFAAGVFSTCSPPAGTIDSSGNGTGNGNGGRSGYDTFWLIPERLFYESPADSFNQYDDLQIMTSDNGLVRQVDPDEPGVVIEISEKLSLGYGPPYFLPFVFQKPGIYRIEVRYNVKRAAYTVEVRGYYVPPGSGSDFLDIIWL
jgi:hypothetical protein